MRRTKQTDEPSVKNTVEKKTDLTCEKCVMSGDKETIPDGNERVYCEEYEVHSDNHGNLCEIHAVCPLYRIANKRGLFDFRRDRE